MINDPNTVYAFTQNVQLSLKPGPKLAGLQMKRDKLMFVSHTNTKKKRNCMSYASQWVASSTCDTQDRQMIV